MLFRSSTTSFQTYDCLKHNPEFAFTETNFIELGVPFFRNDIYRKVLRFLDAYRYEKSDWGIDKVLCYYLQASAHVVHDCTVRHMLPDESTYNKEDGFREMEYLMRDFFPKYMRDNFGLDYQYSDVQQTIRAYKHG